LRFMRQIADRTVPVVAGLRGARVIGSALLAGLIAGGTLLAIGAHVLSPSGIDPAESAAAQAAPGGETIVAKLAQAETASASGLVAVQPTHAGRLLAMALAPMPSVAPPRKIEPNLEGLSEIPRELIWNRPPDEEDEAKPKAFAAFSKAREELPWDATEPVPFSPLAPSSAPAKAAGAKPVAAIHQPLSLPAGGQVETWMRAKATEIKGADRTRPLFHFEFWLEPPAEMRRRLVGVAYDFSTPAIRPQSQASSDQASGFRISAGGLACADEITVTLTFDDGRAQKVAVDGCKLLS